MNNLPLLPSWFPADMHNEDVYALPSSIFMRICQITNCKLRLIALLFQCFILQNFVERFSLYHLTLFYIRGIVLANEHAK